MEYESDDILRVTKSGDSRVVNYIRDDADTITVNPDPYNERGEITYRKSEVTVEVLGRSGQRS